MRRPVKPQRDARIDALGNDERSVLILKEILRDFNKDVQAVYETIIPIEEAVRPIVSGGGIGLVSEPLNFASQVVLNGIQLSWESPNPAARLYEIRRSGQLNWNTASFVTRTPSLSILLDPLPYGSYFFLIKTLDTFGNYSPNFASTTVIIIPPGRPFVTAAVIDNNVLLNWTVPTTSFTIDRYRIFRNETLYGALRATFVSTFETVAGEYKYGVEAIDIAGNVSDIGEVTTTVNTPPDYQLLDTKISDLNGTMENVVRSPAPSLIACVDTNITWEQHFVNRLWDDIEDQINAGYPIYIQPTLTTGWYEEVIDYGIEIQNTIVTVTYQLVQIVPEVSILMYLSYSSDGIVFTPLPPGPSQFVPIFQYLKMRLEFTGSDDHALAECTVLTTTLDVKREVDGGEVIAYASGIHNDPDGNPVDHANGTPVKFNKTFKDVNSITATCDSIEPIIIIYDFLDIPNPVGFKVFALDSTGNRVTYLVSWKARGIV
jgi:hypothetical protein